MSYAIWDESKFETRFGQDLGFKFAVEQDAGDGGLSNYYWEWFASQVIHYDKELQFAAIRVTSKQIGIGPVERAHKKLKKVRTGLIYLPIIFSIYYHTAIVDTILFTYRSCTRQSGTVSPPKKSHVVSI
jgi:hypothetical protein